ncbi:TonB-dependent receptor [Novosphingobium sp.]|uniref:TonB-dependent receptor n=1 Tax=Novosphingobium sp. TaxID=1874826 RepID=UPI0038BC8579
MKLIRTACLASVFTLAVPAYAQDAQTTGAQDAAAAAASTGDIIVTATRQSTLLSKTPITLSAISGDQLKSAGVTDARALSMAVPNLALTESGDAVRISIRGVTSTDTTEKGDPSAAFLLDGIYIARPSDALGSFYDVERVEVLRGPQGTLYGRNTTAGVINVISAKPKDEFAASLDGSYGSLNTVDTTGMINLRVADGLGVRAAVNYQRQDTFYTVNGTSPTSVNPFRETLSARLSFGGKLGDNLTFVVRGDYSNTKGSGSNGNLVTLDRFYDTSTVGIKTVNPVYVDHPANYERLLTVAPIYPSQRNNKNYGIMGEFTYDFGPVQLTYLGAYRKTDRDDTRNLLLFSALNNPAFFFGTFKQDSHELRLAFGQGSRLHGQVGGYYFHEKSSLEFNLGAPLSSIVVPNATGFAFPQGPTVSKSKAAFGQLTFDITPALHITGGIRYTNDFKSRNGATVVDFADVTKSICGKARCVLNENVAARTFNKTIWKVGVDYDAPGLGLIYAAVSTGYKAGGFNDGCVTGAGVGCALTPAALYYNPETLTNYEAGVKFRISPAFRFNAAVFHYDYDSLQVSQVVTVPIPATLISNAAKAKVDGVELEATLKPSDTFTVDLGYTYTNARYANFVPDAVNFPNFSFKGAALDHAPKNVVTGAVTKTIPLGDGSRFEATLRSRLSSEYYIIDLNNLSQFRQPSFTKTDATITYTAPHDRFYVQGFVKNIENKITIANAATGLGAGVTIEAPRQYGVRAGLKF